MRLVMGALVEGQAVAQALIATQQPMARDLRIIAAVLDIASELERIGDYAKGIARINLMIGAEPFINPSSISRLWHPERETCCTSRWRPPSRGTRIWPARTATT